MEITAQNLLSAHAVRKRCHYIYNAALEDNTLYFKLNTDCLDTCAEFVLDITKRNYPDLNIPYHSRWRHFVVDGADYWDIFKQEKLGDFDNKEQSRIAIDLAFTSVLLDAGAGSKWTYRDPRSGKLLNRSEGLAIASLDMFCNGLFSSSVQNPYRADAKALANLTEQSMLTGFQSDENNPLLGIQGRSQILRGLGTALRKSGLGLNPDNIRPGNLLDNLVIHAQENENIIRADHILEQLLHLFGEIWPNGTRLNGVMLGDTGIHSLYKTNDNTSELVPFHKLTQWLTYSIIEPLQWTGMTVTNIDKLTGLPEYRNGGLFIDFNVIEPRDPKFLADTHDISSEAITEWRALTVALLDQIAIKIRQQLKQSESEMPLAKILQGGTWAAGREIAKRKRGDSSPPINLNIDGTIF